MSPHVGILAGDAMALFIDAVQLIPPDRWQQPSNLEGWTVEDLVGHATGSAAKIVALVEDREIWGRSEPDDWASEDPVLRLEEFQHQLRQALPDADFDAARTSPQGEVPLRRALTFPVSDLALHSWDLHRSQGRMIELPGELLSFCESLVQSVPENMLRRPGGFAPAQPVGDNASATARLMAHLGRSVSHSD